MQVLLASWLAVTALVAAVWIVRRRLEANETDWLPLGGGTSGDIQRQELIEGKVRRLTPVLHWLEGADLVLLLALAAWWIHEGVNSVRW